MIHMHQGMAYVTSTEIGKIQLCYFPANTAIVALQQAVHNSAASQSYKVHVIQGPYMQAMTGRTRFGIYIDAVQRDSRENALHHLSTTSGESIENGLRVSAMA